MNNVRFHDIECSEPSNQAMIFCRYYDGIMAVRNEYAKFKCPACGMLNVQSLLAKGLSERVGIPSRRVQSQSTLDGQCLAKKSVLRRLERIEGVAFDSYDLSGDSEFVLVYPKTLVYPKRSLRPTHWGVDLRKTDTPFVVSTKYCNHCGKFPEAIVHGGNIRLPKGAAFGGYVCTLARFGIPSVGWMATTPVAEAIAKLKIPTLKIRWNWYGGPVNKYGMPLEHIKSSS